MAPRNKIADIIEKDITSFANKGYEMHVYYGRDRMTISEVSFSQKGKGGGLYGCSYMCDLWTPTALKRIAEIAQKAGVPRKNKY